jgi:hypothetical protein
MKKYWKSDGKNIVKYWNHEHGYWLILKLPQKDDSGLQTL